MDDCCVEKAEGVARQVWQEFSPHDGEELTYRDALFWVTIAGSGEGFDFYIDPDESFGDQVSALADKLQSIVMEGRQQMVPDCPLHHGAHPMDSEVVDGAAAWVCPSTRRLVRYIRVSADIT
jgi:hypothetical protein